MHPPRFYPESKPPLPPGSSSAKTAIKRIVHTAFAFLASLRRNQVTKVLTTYAPYERILSSTGAVQ